jgi:hypothetical protein
MEIKIDPNCVFPEDMTQTELDEMIADFKQMIEDGTLEENSEILTDEEYDALVKQGIIKEEEIVIN